MTDDADADESLAADTTFRTFISNEFKAVNEKIDAQAVESRGVRSTLKEQDEVLKKQDELLEKMAASAEKSAEAHSRMVSLVEQALKIAQDDAAIKHDLKTLKHDVSEHDFRLERLELHAGLKRATTDG